MVLTTELSSVFAALDDDAVSELGRIGVAYATTVGLLATRYAEHAGRSLPDVREIILADNELMKLCLLGYRIMSPDYNDAGRERSPEVVQAS